MEKNNKGPTLEEIRLKYEKNPNNLDNILNLSEKYFVNNNREDAFNLLLNEYNNHKEKKEIKKALLKYFDVLGNDSEHTKYFRKKFSLW